MPDYFREVDAMLADVPVEQWKSYLRFHVVDSASPYLSDAFVQQNYEFYNKTLSGQKELEPRWKRVLGTIDGQVGEAMGQLYVKVAFPPESKAKMEALVANLGEALKARCGACGAAMSPRTGHGPIQTWQVSHLPPRRTRSRGGSEGLLVWTGTARSTPEQATILVSQDTSAGASFRLAVRRER